MCHDRTYRSFRISPEHLQKENHEHPEQFFRILNCSFILRHFSLTNTFLVTKDFFKYLFKVAILICCLKSHLRTSHQCFMHSPVQNCHIFVHTRLPSDLHYFSISLKLILFTCQINNCKLLKQHFIFQRFKVCILH